MSKNTSTLPLYLLLSTTDHDQKVKIEKQELFCYSRKQLDKLYPDKDYKIVGETRAKNKKEAIAQLKAGEKTLDVSEFKSNSRLLNKCVGYARVNRDEYIALLRSRVPFLILLLCCIAALIIAVSLLMGAINEEPPGPVVIDPDHPMPTQDINATPNEDDNSEKAQVEEGGGSLSMIYSLDAELNLTTGQIRIYFMNPNASTHDVSLILYVVSGDTEVPIAQSGRISAGYSLTSLTMVEGTAALSEGVYTGYYMLSLFDPETGERALVQPEITGVQLVVTH